MDHHGVDPDIEVANTPKEVIAGRDPQLERGIEEVVKRMKEDPEKLPTRPKDPVKKKSESRNPIDTAIDRGPPRVGAGAAACYKRFRCSSSLFILLVT